MVNGNDLQGTISEHVAVPNLARLCVFLPSMYILTPIVMSLICLS